MVAIERKAASVAAAAGPALFPARPAQGDDESRLIAGHLRYLRLRGLSAATVYDRRRALARLSGFLGLPLCEATPELLEKWRASLELSDKAVVVYVSHIRQFFAWTVQVGLLEANPAGALPVPRQGRMLPRPIGDEALFAAVAAAPDRVRPWLVLAGWAGLRAKEIALLQRPAVLETASPPVLLIRQGATKGNSERVVPMSDFVAAELVPLLPAGGYVFPRHDGRRGPNTPQRVSQLANRFLHDFGVPESLHQLRHRFGTATYRAGGRDLRLVQELMGHRSPATTAGYAAFDSADGVAAVQALPVPGPVHQRVTGASA